MSSNVSRGKVKHMRMKLGFAAAAFIFALTCAQSAQASYYVWEDKVHGFKFTFPDSWTLQSPDQPSTVVRIAGPVGEDFATCRVKAVEDGRLKIYPKPLMTEAVDETLTRDFWENEVGQYENPVVTEYYAPAGLGGKGDATAIKTSFVFDSGAGKRNMYGSMIGSIYGGTRYVVACSSSLETYAQYAPVFSTIMSSVELDSRYHPYTVGYYRNFLADPKVLLPRSKPGTTDLKSKFQVWSIF